MIGNNDNTVQKAGSRARKWQAVVQESDAESKSVWRLDDRYGTYIHVDAYRLVPSCCGLWICPSSAPALRPDKCMLHAELDAVIPYQK